MSRASAKGKYARVVDTDAGKCFLLVQWPDAAVLEEQGFDMVLFHARSMRTFVGKGLKLMHGFLYPELWMPLAERALAQGLESVSAAGVTFTFDVNTGQLQWIWAPGAAGKDLGAAAVVQKVVLTALPPDQPGTALQLEAMLGAVFDNFYLLQHACEQLDRQLGLKAAELAARSQELQKSHEAHQAEMADMYIKVALALNAKTDKLVDQRDRIQQLEAQVKTLQEQLHHAVGVNGVSAMDAVQGGYGGGAGTEARGQSRRAAAGAAAAGGGAGPGVGRGEGPGGAGRAAGGACPMDVDGATGAGAQGSDSDEDLGLRRGPGAAPTATAAAPVAAEVEAAGPSWAPAPVYASLGATQVDEDLLLAETQPAARGPLLPPPGAAPLQSQERAAPQQQQGHASGAASAAAAQPAAAPGRSGPATWGLGLGGDDDDSDDDAALGLRLR
ncbi:hypothetical protein HXX76_007118 [Chlamydomonas incerta]|uniref:Uncharacterized protein n=1 Tax=Chlamydomonas incerta TaxID=51695 RepID=A0A835SZ97_CHLIN|nr:hypothetical protein HXX76_007118 [Chlamydomonas incerta]|eukprot:KAG2435923.1 hypothetical protein HXX76_007118 [Chlamydomonas incerta]